VVTAAQRRQAVRQLQETFGVSQRRACRLVGQPRSTQRQRPKTSEEEERLVRRMLELVRRHPRFGYRRIGVLLRREGWRVNRKRVYRLWRQQGLKVPRKQRKKRRLGHSGNPWMTAAGLETLYIAPGAPWENGYAESFNSKVRDELLNAEEFGSVVEAKILAREWRQEYNPVRPHRSLEYRTPAEFGEKCPRPDCAALHQAEDTSITVDPTLTAPGT
jgi:transposase InsO family protein